MDQSVHKREFDIFLSHAHRDKELVDKLDKWLTVWAGLKVWYDGRELSGGAMIATDLQNAISRCRGMLIIASDTSVQKNWVKAEYNAAMDEQSSYSDFRVVALRVDNANVDGLLMGGQSWIDISSDELKMEEALAIIKAFYPGEKRPNPGSSKDVYVSCSWRRNDSMSANAVMKTMVDVGFRLIGDSEDQDGFGDGDRVERIIESCGAFVGILPYRGQEEAKSKEKPYKYFLKEIDYAMSLDMPVLIIADPRIKRIDGDDNKWLRMETEADTCSPEIINAIEDLYDDWEKPIKPQFVFLATDLSNPIASPVNPIRNLIERVTGMQTKIGTDITTTPIQDSIISAIRDSFLLIADISENNLDTCIEAGMGLSAKTNVAIITQGESRRPPFMLRSLQLPNYFTEVERLGLIHKIIWPYRRRVINSEI